MATSLTTLGAQCVTNAAAVATALAGGVATADVTALGRILQAAALDPDIMIQIMKKCVPNDVKAVLPQ